MTRARDLADRVNQSAGATGKNLLINGHMGIFQRSTSVSSITTTNYYTADRWRTAANSLGVFTQSRSFDVPSAQGFNHSLKMDCTSANASPLSNRLLILQQKIEGQNLQHLLKGSSSSKAITLSFWVKSNKTGRYVIEIDHEAAGRSISKSYTINSADTWEKKEITFEGDTSTAIANDNGIGLSILWWLAAGSNYTSGTLQTSWGVTVGANRAVGQVNLADSTSNEWYLTGCQLEVGEKATDFEFESYPKVLEKCQRYYFRPSNGVYGWQGRRGGGRFVRVNNRTQGTIEFPTTMRASPSLSATRSYGDGIWSSGSISANNGWSNPFSPNFINIEANVNVNSGSGNGGTFGFSIKISAEL